MEHADLCSAYIDHRGLIGGGLFVAKTTFPSTPVNSPGGYKSVPQWMNDKAHCLKCDAVVKTRNSIHGEVPVPENVQKDLGASRLPGEARGWPAATGGVGGGCGEWHQPQSIVWGAVKLQV